MARTTPIEIAGGAYKHAKRPFNVQDTVNYIPEIASNAVARSRSMLRGAPGLVAFSVTTEPLSFDPPPCPIIGVEFSYTVVATGGIPPYAWSITGTLPPGISFSQGVFSGTATETGNFSYTITVTDSVGTQFSVEKRCDVFIFLTSTIYPIESIEEMESAFQFSGGLTLSQTTEAFDTSLSFVSGELRTIFLSSDMNPEAFDSAVSFVSGELRSILLSTTMAPEAFDSTLNFVSGELKTILVENSMAPEGMDSTFGFVGGTLS